MPLKVLVATSALCQYDANLISAEATFSFCTIHFAFCTMTF